MNEDLGLLHCRVCSLNCESYFQCNIWCTHENLGNAISLFKGKFLACMVCVFVLGRT